MKIEVFFTILATIASLSISTIGIPIQVWKNYKSKKTKDISTTLFVLSFASYSFWSLRAFFIKDWYMFIAYIPGVFFSAIILYQMHLYRKNNN